MLPGSLVCVYLFDVLYVYCACVFTILYLKCMREGGEGSTTIPYTSYTLSKKLITIITITSVQSQLFDLVCAPGKEEGKEVNVLSQSHSVPHFTSVLEEKNKIKKIAT